MFKSQLLLTINRYMSSLKGKYYFNFQILNYIIENIVRKSMAACLNEKQQFWYNIQIEFQFIFNQNQVPCAH